MLWRNSPRRGRRILPSGFIEPCAPTVVAKPPSGPGWLHEIKHDGYRMLLRKEAGRVRLFTRRGFDWTQRYPQLVAAAEALKATSLLIDGEAVCAGEGGVTDFAKLHSRVFDQDVFLYAFDLLELDGEDLRRAPQIERKGRLQKLLRRSRAAIVFNEHDDGDGAIIFKHACKLGLEGIVSKRADAPYRTGRARCWVKTKNPKSPAMLRLEDG
jgi:bifunctional non-homologous end joining protein LigD